jgi:hypothetical protein
VIELAIADDPWRMWLTNGWYTGSTVARMIAPRQRGTPSGSKGPNYPVLFNFRAGGQGILVRIGR